MASNKNFDRQYRLAAGPSGGTGFEVGATSDSQPIPLHVSFQFQRSELQAANTGKVAIWNLNDDHLAVLNEPDCYLIFRAGYGNRLPKVFSGVVSYSTTTTDGADRKTEIEIIDSLIEMRDTYVSVCYNGIVSWRKIFDDVAAQMGIAITYSYNVKFTSVSNGFSFVGPAKEILEKGCDSCNLEWSIQNGILQIKQPGDVMSKEVYLLSPDHGLIGIPSSVVISQDQVTGKNSLGWDVVFLMNAAINIDDYVKLESKSISGYFRVYSMDITGDNLSGDWICKARLLEVNES